VLAKVDVTLNEGLADRYGIENFPTFVFYAYGNRIDYEAGNFDGGRTVIAFSKFVKRKSMPAAIEVDECQELKRRTGLNDLNLVYFGDFEGEGFEAFKRAGKNPKISKKFSFYKTTNPECVMVMLGINPLKSDLPHYTALVRSFDESPILYRGPLV